MGLVDRAYWFSKLDVLAAHLLDADLKWRLPIVKLKPFVPQ